MVYRSSSNLQGLGNWLTTASGLAADPLEIADGLFQRLVDQGVPLMRGNIAMTTLHPEIVGFSYRWTRDTGETVRLTGSRANIERERMYERSPYQLVFEQGVAGIRRRLERDDEQRDLGVLADLREAGATDYVVMASSSGFTGGVIASWTTDRPGGFTTQELVLVEQELQAATLVLENRALRDIAVNLLNTYVGARAGTRILTGQIIRGSGETLQAVFWAVDMRGFTRLSDNLPRDELITLLNNFYDRAITPVQNHGGEVIKFVGDGVLAVFPVDESGDPANACARALAATDEALAALSTWNDERFQAGAIAEIGYGIVLHLGEVNFGNVGTASRLDFTVIGPAVNLASRLERLCSGTGERVLMSEAVAAYAGDRAESIGVHTLPGLSQPQTVFRLRVREESEAAGQTSASGAGD